jgi:cytochrome c-type biogenesis protein CcmH
MPGLGPAAATRLSRRGFLSLGAAGVLGVAGTLGAAAQDSLTGAGPSGRLWDPNRAGRPQPPTTARDSDPAIQALEKRLRCTCGCGLDVYTCRTTDFSCTTSPAMHREVLALLDDGKTAEEVIQAFVDRHGQAILMAPPKRGFNLAGYFVPGAVLLVAGALLVVALRRWTRSAAVAAAAAGPAAPAVAEASPEELARLQRELDEFSA